MWVFFIGIFVGIILACLAVVISYRHLMVGVLRIDRSDPDDQPYTFLELTKDERTLSSKKYVILQVSTENYISQN